MNPQTILYDRVVTLFSHEMSVHRISRLRKTLWVRQNFTGLYVWDDGSASRRMLKKASN
jgi:hypothetical protein